MKKTTIMVVIMLVCGLLVLGLGYAAIQNITLTITGTASAEPNQESFDIVFSGDHVISDEGCASVTMVDDITSNILVTGLTAKGESLVVEYDVKNSSNALSADLEVLTQNSNTEYFTLTSYVLDICLDGWIMLFAQSPSFVRNNNPSVL